MGNLLIIELGMGADLHGQNITKASIRAVENAIQRISLPGLGSLALNNDLNNMKVNDKLAIPCGHESLDLNQVREIFPYGKISVEIVAGGMLTSSGVFLSDKGDKNDLIYIVNAAVEVSY